MDGNGHQHPPTRARTGRRRSLALATAIATLGLALTASAAFGGLDGVATAVRDNVYCKVVRDCVYDAPETHVAHRPHGYTDDPRLTFRFLSDENPVTYRCRFDGAPFQVCENPYHAPGLSDGKHVLEVAAVDEDGLVDPTPARRVVVIDTDRPHCSVVDGPHSTRDHSPSFDLHSSEKRSKFEYRLDHHGRYHRTGDKVKLHKLRPGKHLLQARSVDRAGNTGSADEFGFRIVGGKSHHQSHHGHHGHHG